MSVIELFHFLQFNCDQFFSSFQFQFVDGAGSHVVIGGKYSKEIKRSREGEEIMKEI